MASAPGLGPGGCRFESCLPDTIFILYTIYDFLTLYIIYNIIYIEILNIHIQYECSRYRYSDKN